MGIERRNIHSTQKKKKEPIQWTSRQQRLLAVKKNGPFAQQNPRRQNPQMKR